MKKRVFNDNYLINLILVTTVVFLIEILFRSISNFEIISYSSLRILFSSFIITFVVTFLSSLTNKKWIKNTINILYVFIYSMYAWLQLGFINYLGVYMSFNTSSQLGAVKDYIGDFLLSIKPLYYVIFLPFIALLLFYLVLFKKKEYYKNTLKLKSLLFIPFFITSCFIYYLTLVIPFMQNDFQIKSNTKLFVSPDVPTVAVNQFGTTVFGVLDLKSYIFPIKEEETTFDYNNIEEDAKPSREVLPVLSMLASDDNEKEYSSLNNYFASQKIDDFNEYTGLFEGKNVVVILMESGNPALINEDYFPNFYKLYSEGWHWINNYSPRNSCATGNNEFSAMTSLYSIYNTCTSNVYKDNKYFEAIFNLFNDAGYRTTSFHDFVEWYYKRNIIHPNMGSSKYYGASQLGIKTASYYGEWPSDEELFEKAFDIVLNTEDERPFMTWLTTVTSHQPYSNSSTYGDLYKDFFINEGYSTYVSRYLSKLKVVDNALGIMIEKLDEKGVLDDTVIAVLADHYPYGLSQKYIKEMIDYDLDDYDIEKTPFLIYNSKINGTEMKEYSSYINLLPTIANLLNLNYDPRLYAGDDLFSNDYESRVVFADGSWKNDIAYYNASTSSIKYYGETVYTNEEIREINNKVRLQIDMSSRAIKTNYFNYLKQKIDNYLNGDNNEVTE